jgi:hypothetical protein
MEIKNNCMIEVLKLIAVETIKKEWLTKAEHNVLNGAKLNKIGGLINENTKNKK